jgi:hypothetical protein
LGVPEYGIIDSDRVDGGVYALAGDTVTQSFHTAEVFEE